MAQLALPTSVTFSSSALLDAFPGALSALKQARFTLVKDIGVRVARIRKEHIQTSQVDSLLETNVNQGSVLS